MSFRDAMKSSMEDWGLIFHYISVLVMAVMIVCLWNDDDLWFFFYILFGGVLVTIPAFLFCLYSFGYAIYTRFQSINAKILFVLDTLLLISGIVYAVWRAPELRADAFVMEKNYIAHEDEIWDAVRYTREVMNDSSVVALEFDDKKMSAPYWLVSGYENAEDMLQQSGLDSLEVITIGQKLAACKCIGIRVSKTSSFAEVWFRRVGMGMYRYLLDSEGFSQEQQNKFLDDYSRVPFCDSVAFEYGSGAIGSGKFVGKEEYLQKRNSR